jgi:hypothetical protein
VGVNCTCEKGLTLCPTAAKLWRAYRAAVDISERLMTATFGDGADDPIAYDRWRISCDLVNGARREYDRHVDSANEPTPQPRSLKAVS